MVSSFLLYFVGWKCKSISPGARVAWSTNTTAHSSREWWYPVGLRQCFKIQKFQTVIFEGCLFLTKRITGAVLAKCCQTKISLLEKMGWPVMLSQKTFYMELELVQLCDQCESEACWGFVENWLGSMDGPASLTYYLVSRKRINYGWAQCLMRKDKWACCGGRTWNGKLGHYFLISFGEWTGPSSSAVWLRND